MAIVRSLRTSGEFLSGIIIGVLVTYNLLTLEFSKSTSTWKNVQDEERSPPKNSISDEIPREDDMPSTAEEVAWPAQEIVQHKSDDDSLALKLKSEIRILCWVMTSPRNIAARAVHVNATWGQRCNILLFMSSKATLRGANNLSLPIVQLDVPEGRSNLWEKTKAAFKYIYKHHLRDADWFFKTDDDTFAIMENLRFLLKDKRPHLPVYLGRRFKRFVGEGYMSGGAGYVLSRAAVRKFVTVLLETPSLCPDIYFGVEDVLLGMCLEKCGVKALDTRDVSGRQRFHPLAPWDMITVDYIPKDFWLFDTDFYPTRSGTDCCSDYSITFHYIPSHLMYVMDFLVYRVRPHGFAKDKELLKEELDRKTRF